MMSRSHGNHKRELKKKSSLIRLVSWGGLWLAVLCLPPTVAAQGLNLGAARALPPGHGALEPPPAHYGNLGTLFVNGVMVPAGRNQTVGIIEATNGIPDLPHPFLPGGQINLLPQVAPNDPVADAPTSHATEVTGVVVSSNAMNRGIAPASTIWAAGHTGSTGSILNTQGVALNGAHIVNHSYGGAQAYDGTSTRTRFMDWSATTKPGHQIQDILHVFAGSEDSNTGPLRGPPADSFNGITVGSLGQDPGPWYDYRKESSFNRSDLNITDDLSPITGLGRFKTDIMAPGHEIVMPTLGGGMRANSGTSFAAPHVSGAAALLREYSTFPPEAGGTYSTDHRVLKAVLLNSASKDVENKAGRRWRSFGNTGFNKAGGVPIIIGQDEDLGMGGLDVLQSMKQYKRGEQDPGPVDPIAWDLEPIPAGGTNSYNLRGIRTIKGIRPNPSGRISRGDKISATLAWDRTVPFNDTNGNNRWDDGETFGAGTLRDLDLGLTNIRSGVQIAQATSDIDSVEHIFTAARGPKSRYRLDVVNRDIAASDDYALAWSVTKVDRFETHLHGLNVELNGMTFHGGARGPSIVELQDVGPVDGDNLDDLLTEMVSLDLRGNLRNVADPSQRVKIKMRESQHFDSLGAIEEKINNVNGTIEFDDDDMTGDPRDANSFFDMLFEIEVEIVGGRDLVLFNKDPIRMVNDGLNGLPPTIDGGEYFGEGGALDWWNTYQGSYMALDPLLGIDLYNMADPHGAPIGRLIGHPQHWVVPEPQGLLVGFATLLVVLRSRSTARRRAKP